MDNNLVSHVLLAVMAKPELKIEFTDSSIQPSTSGDAIQPGPTVGKILLRTLASADSSPAVVRPFERGELVAWVSGSNQDLPGTSTHSEGAIADEACHGPRTSPRPGPNRRGELPDTRKWSPQPVGVWMTSAGLPLLIHLVRGTRDNADSMGRSERSIKTHS